MCFGDGSMKVCKLGPQRLQAEQSLFSEPRIRRPQATGNGFGPIPADLAVAGAADCLASRHAEPHEHLAPTFRSTPPLPETDSDATTKPLIEFVQQLQLRRQTEVSHLAANVTSQLGETMFHRNPSAAAGDLADAMLEPLQALPRDVDRGLGFHECKVEKLELFPRHHAALLLVHHQTKFIGQVTGSDTRQTHANDSKKRSDK